MDEARGERPPGRPASSGKPAAAKPITGRSSLDSTATARSPQRLGIASGRYGATGRAPVGSTRATGKRRLPLPVVLGLMLVGGLCALLALNTASAALEVEQRGLADTNATDTDNQQQLLRDLAAKQAPGSLASAAVALGLVPNMNPAFLRINANGSVTVLGSPVPATAPPVPVAAPSPTKSTTPKPTATPTATSSKAAAPQVTVTVTRPAPAPAVTRPASPAPAASHASPHPSSSAPGGH